MTTPAQTHGDIQTRLGNVEATLAGGALPADYRWSVPASMTSIDEFDDALLDPAWVRVDAAGTEARVAWREGADVLSLRQFGTDPGGQLHALMRPIGAAMVPGDAFVTCATLFGPWATNYTMAGLILADGVVHGAGAQVHTLNYISTTGNVISDTRQCTGYQSGTAAAALNYHSMNRLYWRIVMVTADTWRCDVSPDGVSWVIGTAVTRAVTPTHVGFLASSWSTAVQAVVSYEFLRRTTV